MFYYLSFKYTQPMKLAKNRAGGGRIELQTKSIIDQVCDKEKIILEPEDDLVSSPEVFLEDFFSRRCDLYNLISQVSQIGKEI